MKKGTAPIMESEKEMKTRQCHTRARCVGILLLLVVIVVVVVVVVVVKVKHDDDDDDDDQNETLDTVEGKRDALQSRIGRQPVVRISTDFTNWDKLVKRNKMLVVAPSTLDEIQRVVKAARDTRIKMRCVGMAYSFSDLYADEGDLLVETHKIRTRHDGPAMQLNTPIPGVDLWTVTAAAGLSQADIRDFFLQEGVQYRSTATPLNVLIGGLIGTASHGASAQEGTVSDLVVAVRLVDSEGELRSYNSLQHPEQMAMVKCCVGMCGVIYDVTFQVEKLSVTTVNNLFNSSYDLFNDTAWLVNYLKTSDPLMYWAPLSSLSAAEWQEYSVTGKIPASYDPWNDQYWTKSYTYTGRTSLPDDGAGRRKRSLSYYNYVPSLITGKLNEDVEQLPSLVRYKRDVTSSDDSTEGPISNRPPNPTSHGDALTVEVTSKAPLEETTDIVTAPDNKGLSTEAPSKKTTDRDSATYSVLQTIHQGTWNDTYGYFKDVPPMDLYYPEAVMFQNGSTLHITYSMAFTFADDSVLSTTKRVMTFLLEKLRQEALQGRMPVLTLELDWIRPSRDCYLCPQVTPQNHTDVAQWFALTFIGASYKPDYQPFLNQIFNDLKTVFPSMRVEWAKFYSFVNGLQPFIKDSFADNLSQFQEVHRREKLDPLHLFKNAYLADIFGS